MLAYAYPGAFPGGPPAAGELPCQHEPALFFAERPADVARAKELCALCPVRATCLTGALQRGEPCGVWGGELFFNGRVIAVKRPRGRPRKTPVAA